jgi:hypothetical protein
MNLTNIKNKNLFSLEDKLEYFLIKDKIFIIKISAKYKTQILLDN